MQKCYIFGALEPKELYYIPENNDFVIAADKGLSVVEKLNIKPDHIIGDFDSLGFVPAGDNVIKLPVEKDDTDIGYAVKYALSKGCSDFVIYGGIGGQIDHTFANIQLCAYISKRGGRAVFVGDGVFVTAVTDSGLTFENASGRVSVFSADTTSKGVCLRGFKYDLDNAVLSSDFPLGVSNEFIGKNATVSVEKGTLVIITHSKI